MASCRRELRGGRRSGHQTRTKIRGIGELFEIPAEMFASDPHPGVLAVEGVEGFEMREDDTTHFSAGERCARLLYGQPGIDIAKNPWRTARCAAEHYSVSTSEIKYVARLLRRVDITVCKNGNLHHGLDRADRLVLGRATV